MQFGHANAAKVAEVAEHRNAHQTRQHNGRDDEAAGARFKLARQLFNRKHHASQRGVEGCSNPRCAASHQKCMCADGGIRPQPAPSRMHDPGSHLHGRPFAPNRQPCQKSRTGKHDLGE